MKKFAAVAVLALLATPAIAEEDRAEGETKTLYSDCAQEQVSIYTTHSYNGYSIEEGQSRFDADKKRVQDIASNVGAKLKLSSESYSISPMNYEAPNERNLFNFSGNLNYEVTPADKGKEFFRQLSSTGINSSLSYSKSDNCEQEKGE